MQCPPKALWLDIDVGDDKPYKTRQDASRALAGFIKELGLPKPWVVASGRAGLHLYFAFTGAVSKDEWQYLADRLKQACKEHGIHQDPAHYGRHRQYHALPPYLEYEGCGRRSSTEPSANYARRGGTALRLLQASS